MKTMFYLILALITILACLMVFAIVKLFMLEKKIARIEETRIDENTSIAQNLAGMSNDIYMIREKTKEHDERLQTILNDKSEEENTIENQIKKANEKVLSDWIDSIVNYDPYKVNS